MFLSPSSVATLLAAAATAASGATATAGSGRDLAQAAPTNGTAAEGDLRLVSQVITNGFTSGALQVFHNGQFGAVCNDGFDAVDAAVACRQLGFSGGFALGSFFPTGFNSPVPPEIQVPFVLENLGCTGAEARLVDCPVAEEDEDYTYRIFFYGDISFSPASTCDPFGGSYAFVACGAGSQPGGPEEGDLRLTGGFVSESGAAFGRLEVFTTGGWGTVCGGTRRLIQRIFRPGRRATFTEASADVACRQLGFQNGALTATPTFVSDALRAVPIVSAGAACNGREDFLADCRRFSRPNDQDACSHLNDVSLVCYNGSDPAMDGTLRLMGGAAGPGYEYGRLEVFLRGFWSSVCNVNGFAVDSAAVACRILGFGGGASLEFFQPFHRRQSTVLEALLPVGLASVDCAGNETSLLACSCDDTVRASCAGIDSSTVDATVLACGTSEPGISFCSYKNTMTVATICSCH